MKHYSILCDKESKSIFPLNFIQNLQLQQNVTLSIEYRVILCHIVIGLFADVGQSSCHIVRIWS